MNVKIDALRMEDFFIVFKDFDCVLERKGNKTTLVILRRELELKDKNKKRD